MTRITGRRKGMRGMGYEDNLKGQRMRLQMGTDQTMETFMPG